MSSRTTAAIYLEGLQEHVDGLRTDDLHWPRSRDETIAMLERADHRDGMRPDFMSDYGVTDEMVREARDGYIRKVAEVELPSRFEDPATYLQIKEQDALLREIIREPCPGVALGTLPLGQINAASIPVPGSDDFIIVVDQGLVSFAHNAAHTAIQGLPSRIQAGELQIISDLEAIKRHSDQNTFTFQPFRDLAWAYLFTGDPASYKPPKLSADLYLLAVTLEQSMLRFVLAHEYSHIRAGHCSGISGMMVKPTGVLLDRVDYSWEQELEADENGVTLTLAAGARRKEFSILTFAGIDLFLSFHAIFEKAAAIVRFGETKTAATQTHPPSDSRRARIRDIVRTRLFFQRMSEKGRFLLDDPIGAQLIEMGQAIEVMLEHWFQRLIPELKQAHRENKPLAPLWYEVAHIDRTWSAEPPSLFKAAQDFVKELAEGISMFTTKKDIDQAIRHFQSEMMFRYTGNPRREQLIAEADRKQEELAREYGRKMAEEIFGSKE